MKKKSQGHLFAGYSSLPCTLLIAVLAGLLFLSTKSVQAQQREAFKIQWRDYTFFTNRPLPSMPKALTLEAYPRMVRGYYFVQFTGPITKGMKVQAAAAGAELLNYVPNNAYIARMDAEARARVEALPIVQWVDIYQPAMRLSRRLMKRIEGAEIERPKPRPPLTFEKPKPQPELLEPAPLQLTVLVFKGEDLKRVSQAVTAAGGTVLVAQEGKRRSTLRVSIPVEKTAGLAQVNGIMWIEEFKLPKLFNNTARGVMNVAPVWTGHSLRGNGQFIGIADSGLDSGTNDATMHADVRGPRIVNIFSWPVQAGLGALNSTADDGASDLDSGHGTHVTGSVLGDGSISGGTFSGVAPEASLVFQAIEQFTDWPAFPGAPSDGYYLTGIPADLNGLFQQAYDVGARIHTNSWGSDVAGAYTAESEDVDEFVWDHPDMLILFAAGNAGVDADQNNVIDLCSVGSPGTAKNALTVGASENNRPTILQTYAPGLGPVLDADQVANNTSGMAAFSSRGAANCNTPGTADDRIKPDLVAPGTMIASLRSQASPNTIWFIDNMESGVSGWTAGGTWAQVNTDFHSTNTSWHDSPAGNYANNVNISLTSPVKNLSGGGLGGKVIQFWSRYALGSGDQWFLEVSNDGGTTWPGQLPFSGTQANWELISIGLGPFSNAANFRVRFRLQSDNDGNTADGHYIDDVRIVEGAFGSSLLSDQGLVPPGSINDQNYMLSNGTSMATPLAAGAAALVRQYYTDEVGLGYVSAALSRATLINGAAEMSPGQYGTGANREMRPKPNNVEGWGRVDLENSLFPAAPTVLDFVDELAGLETGESRIYNLKVTDNSVPVVITMVYHDFPGASLINNLDMTVTTPGGTTLFPNGLTTLDASNNVEQVVIPTPQIGTYNITINAPSVPEAPQPFALVSRAGGTLQDLEVTVVLDPDKRLGRGETTTVRATVKLNGVPQAGRTVNLRTGDTSQATVSPMSAVTNSAGVATATVRGETAVRHTTTITAEVDGVSASAPVRVPDLSLIGVILLVVCLVLFGLLRKRPAAVQR